MREVFLRRRRGALAAEKRACPLCCAEKPRPHGGQAFYKAGLRKRRPRLWGHVASAFHHPNPLRAQVVLWRCRRHARVRFVPLDEKQGLGGGVYR